MKEFMQVEGIPIPIHIQSYKNCKSIKILYKEGYLKVTKPKWYLTYNIKKYLKDNAKQIYDKYLTIINENSLLLKGSKIGVITKILYKGEMFDIVINKIKENKVFVIKKDYCFEVNIYEHTESDNVNKIINNVLKNELFELSKTYIIDKTQEISKKTGIKYNQIRIKDCKTIWGSCSSIGNLNFNYRLIHMPEWIVESIIIHELCHRRYLNHSKEFWNFVYTYYSEEKYYEAKKWIKANLKEINKI